jgi:leucine dehydrogenase
MARFGAFERVEVRRGQRSGCTVAVAVHSTALGPALGGARLWHYPGGREDAVADARRLAQAMTLKAAAAGLELGGGKGVLAAPPGPPPSGELRRALLLDFADLVESLDGAYVTAEDVGTAAADMATIAERTTHVVGLDEARGGSGDPSPVTALGVVAAIRACTQRRFGQRSLTGLRACVIGLGHVGARVAAILAADGAELVVSDVDPSRRAVAPAGSTWVPAEAAITTPCDVLVPCALGGAIGMAEAERLRSPVVCGAANNVLTSGEVAAELESRGILYAPDFIANAGGLISVYGELRRLPHDRALELAGGIEETMGRILEIADSRWITPLAAAEELAMRRLSPAGHLAAAARG